MKSIAKLICLAVILLAFYGCASGSKTVAKAGGGPEMLRPVDNDLRLAVMKNDVAAAKALIKKGADVKIRYNKNGEKVVIARDGKEHSPFMESRTLLNEAVDNSSVAMAVLLLDGGADIEARMLPDDVTPLMQAVFRQDAESVSLLIDRKADINAYGARGGALALALLQPFEGKKIFTFLLDKGADVYINSTATDQSMGWPARMTVFGKYYMNGYAGGEDIGVRVAEFMASELKKRKLLGKEVLSDAVRECNMAPSCTPEVLEVFLKYGADKDAADMLSESPLEAAMGKGRGDLAKLLVDKGARLELKGSSGPKNLVLAAVTLDVDLTDYVLKKGVKINSVDANGDTALSAVLRKFGVTNAASHLSQREKMAEYLLSMGADINLMLGAEPLLFRVAKADSVEGVKFLLRKGVDISKKDKQGRGVVEAYKEAFSGRDSYGMVPLLSGESGWGLLSAVKAGDIARVKELIEDKFVAVNFANENGESALYLAAQAANGTMVEYLVKRGASLNMQENTKGRTALHASMENGNIMTVNALIAAGASVATEDNNGKRPVHYAVMINDEEKLMAVAKAGADVNARDFDGASPLHMALAKGNMKLAAALISLGANINVMNNLGETPLHEAVKAKGSEAVEFLVSHGASVNAKNNDGRTPLHAAVVAGEYKNVKILASVPGADVNAMDKSGFTPLHLVSAAGRDDMAFILIKRGANVSLKNNEGKSALDMAREGKKQKLISTLTNVKADAL